MRPRLALSFLLLSFVASSPATAGEPPTEPMLRIETGMHTGPIRGIAVDAQNRYLVTGSDDKTVRVWEIATGRLLQVFRPPLGHENGEGLIHAVAISPDGKTVAAGGMTGPAWDGAASLYLFDRDSGRLRQRLTGLPERVLYLGYSKDGRFLVATLGGYGIRVYRTEDGRLVGEDREYVALSGLADFDATGRLVTTSYDGYIRLYDRSFRLIAKAQAPGGRQPYGITFSQDGGLIAVGFDDAPAVNVLSGADLSFQFALNTNGVNGSLGAVSWSSDGTRLYAGGRFFGTGQDGGMQLFIRMWSGSGRGAFYDLPTANKDLIQRLVALRNGGLAYGAADPAWGVIDRNGHEVLFTGPANANYRGNPSDLLLSDDGTVVQFGFMHLGRSPARFALPVRTLELDPAAVPSLRSPRTSAPDITVTGLNTASPKLNGRVLQLDPYENFYSFAIAPNGTAVVIGAQWTLRGFTPTGQEHWKVDVPGSVWAVNITGDNKFILAAHGDGTIRWYRLEDGKELLAFFPHADRKRWVLWTPSGYYDASPGGEELIGWHVNNGKDREADFFPVSKFHSTYYRPDVISKALETLNEQGAVQLANAESGRKTQDTALTQRLPPVITILSPGDGSEVNASEVTVRYVVRSPSGEPLTSLKILVDGRPVAGTRDIAVRPKTPNAESDTQELHVTIPPKDSEIALVAENRYAASTPARVRVRWRGTGPAVSQDAFLIKPKLYVLAVGVSQYQQKELTLGFAAKDARDFVSALQAQHGVLYREVISRVLADAQATREDIMDGLDWIQKETTSKDVAMVFVAGHGVNDPNGIYYFLPVNADPEKLKRTGVAFSDLKNTLASIAGKALFFVDTCHSGNVMGARRGVADINAVVNELSSAENGAVVFAASTGKQYSLEDRAWGNGAFTKALVEGLRGKADYGGKGTISINMLDLYLSERVKELTRGRQTPTTTKPNTVPDFPIALKR